MARPTKAKEPKPKAEGGDSGAANALGGFTGILVNAGLTITIAAIFVGANYWMVSSMIAKLGPQSGEDSHAEHAEVQSTFPYELDDFIINLNNPNEKRYLKVKISLDIERQEGEPEIGIPSMGKKGSSGHGGASGTGSGGHGAPKEPEDPKIYYNKVMEPYKMPIRDIIITQLSSMSAEELSSSAGKEQAKDMIKEEINTILPENRQVIRVNFGDFIIQ